MLVKVIKGSEVTSYTPLKIPPLSGDLLKFPQGGAALSSVTTYPAGDAARAGASESSDIHLEDAHREAEAIIAEARCEAAAIAQAAHEQGLREARLACEVDVNASLTPLKRKLAESIAALSTATDHIGRHYETVTLRLAMEIAKRIIRREVSIDQDIALTMVRVALSRLHERSSITVRLNPSEYAYIESLAHEFGHYAGISMIADPGIEAGGCLVETECGVIDARLECQLLEVERVLTA
jgi:flagellar assembly protein FliH